MVDPSAAIIHVTQTAVNKFFLSSWRRRGGWKSGGGGHAGVARQVCGVCWLTRLGHHVGVVLALVSVRGLRCGVGDVKGLSVVGC